MMLLRPGPQPPLRWPRRGGYVLASGVLHLLVLALIGRQAVPQAPPRAGNGPALRVQLVAASASPRQVNAAMPPQAATERSRKVARLSTPAPTARPQARAVTAAAAAPNEPALHATASVVVPPEPPAEAAPLAPTTPPPAPTAVNGNVFDLPTVAGFGGGAWRLRGSGTGGSPAARSGAGDRSAALPWQQAQQAQQWQLAQAQAFHLQQAWTALQAQLSQWPAPLDAGAPPCALPRAAEPSAAACPAWSDQPGWHALLAAAQAFYQLAPVRSDLVLAQADTGYRLELRP
ncbi:MAG: hypothetical protein ABI574_05025 [Burkholderiales bacterium]